MALRLPASLQEAPDVSNLKDSLLNQAQSSAKRVRWLALWYKGPCHSNIIFCHFIREGTLTREKGVRNFDEKVHSKPSCGVLWGVGGVFLSQDSGWHLSRLSSPEVDLML